MRYESSSEEEALALSVDFLRPARKDRDRLWRVMALPVAADDAVAGGRADDPPLLAAASVDDEDEESLEARSRTLEMESRAHLPSRFLRDLPPPLLGVLPAPPPPPSASLASSVSVSVSVSVSLKSLSSSDSSSSLSVCGRRSRTRR